MNPDIRKAALRAALESLRLEAIQAEHPDKASDVAETVALDLIILSALDTSGRLAKAIDETLPPQTEVERLKAAIRNHRDQRGDDRCWVDDELLYLSLGEPIPLDATALPPKEDFLKSCERYYEQRRCPLDRYPPGKMRIAELEAETERLQGILAKASGILDAYSPDDLDGHWCQTAINADNAIRETKEILSGNG